MEELSRMQPRRISAKIEEIKGKALRNENIRHQNRYQI
jgi:hypothetical protein